VTAWITAVQRIAFVYHATQNMDSRPIRMVSDAPSAAPASPAKKPAIAAPRRAKS